MLSRARASFALLHRLNFCSQSSSSSGSVGGGGHDDAKSFREMRIKSFADTKLAYPKWNERPPLFSPSMRVPDFISKYEHLQAGEKADTNSPVQLAGRLMGIRASGKKLVFLDLLGENHKIQIHASSGSFQREEGLPSFEEMIALLHRGDIVGVNGIPGRTPRGELSLYAHQLVLVAPCIEMIPTTFYGLRDPSLRYRQRHLDMIVNGVVTHKLLTRARVIKTIRTFLDNRGFVEMETPMMSVNAGGASARPFTTRHIDMGRDLHLRVAPELWLKRCVIGGVERVYELGKSFRNEGVDPTHNPEFTTVEAYHAYWDYNNLMTFTEELLREVVHSITGTDHLTLQHSQDQPPTLISFQAPFRRLCFLETIEKGLGYPLPRNLESPESVEVLTKAALQHSVSCPGPKTAARLLDKLADHFIVPLCTQPTFIINTPAVMSPLAKVSPTLPGVCERFELVINGMEIVNAYSELTDPERQRENFVQQGQDRAAGDQEAQMLDEAFVSALEVGLPPTGGWGLGVDRLCMLVTNSRTIKDVMAFPFVRPASEKNV